MSRRLIQLFTFCVLSPLIVSCSPFASKKPPIILIMVESFSEKDFLCSDPRLVEGLDSLQSACGQFLRFTHSFSPSIMTQTAVATLLSGQPVKKHGVTTNGATAISASYETLAEHSLSSGMRTALFSGGIPLLPKFGVRQGYEFYNDSFSHRQHPNRRSFDRSISRSLRWIDEEVGASSFFMTLYVPDLLFKESVTQDNFGDERPQLRHSQLEEFNESIDRLISELKRRGRWDNSHVIVVGLKGESITPLPLTPLSPQFLHVPLQIKLATKIKTNLSELVRELVSFEQLNQWLSQIALHKPSQGKLQFTTSGISPFVTQVSHWHSWLNLASTPHLGLRRKRYFFQLIPEFQIFDSFRDKEESQPISSEQHKTYIQDYKLSKVVEEYFPDQCFDFIPASKPEGANKKPCASKWVDKKTLTSLTRISKWSKQINSKASVDLDIEQLRTQSHNKKDKIVRGWLAYKTLYLRNWTGLFELGKAAKNRSWMLVAQLNLHERISRTPKGCLRYFVGERQNLNNYYRYCQDTELRRVIEGLAKLKDKQRPTQHFWNQVFNIRRRRLATNVNIDMQYMNDVHQSFLFGPSLAELYFFLPEHDSFRKLIETDKS